jgi:hypothetical protein
MEDVEIFGDYGTVVKLEKKLYMCNTAAKCSAIRATES